MARRLQAYLHKNRVGTFTFRWRPPKAERDRFDRAAYEFSLGTKDRTLAWQRAAVAAAMAQRLLAAIRHMPKPKNTSELFKTEFVRKFTFADGSTETIDYDPDNAGEAKEAERVMAEIRQRQTQLAERTATHGSAPARPTAMLIAESPTISEAFKSYCEEKKHSGAWKDPETAEKYDHGPIIREFTEIVGEAAIARLTVNDLRTYRKKIMGTTASITNKAKKLQRTRAFINWARDHAQLTDVPTAVLYPPRAGGEAKHYEPFSEAELKILFESQAYKQQTFAKAHEFWIPLLGLYTGARINEIAQLDLADIGSQDEVDVIRINDDGNKRTKTAASVRTIPIHPSLIAAGFLVYRDTLLDEGWTRLFPELTRSTIGKYGYRKDPSEFFTQYRRACGVSTDEDRVKVFHSFRVTANSALRRQNVPQERRERLVGHESGDTNNRAYRPADRDQMFSIATLRDDLKMVSFDLDHPIYTLSERHREARRQAARRRVRRGASEPQDKHALEIFYGR